jgi:fatty-acyl-CoA synthase
MWWRRDADGDAGRTGRSLGQGEPHTERRDTSPVDPHPTVAAMLAGRASDDRTGLLYGENSWSWREVVEESRKRARVALSVRTDGAFHIGVLLENIPENLFWLGGAAMAGAVVVGINPTRRGEELARDIRFTECQMIVTDEVGADLLEGLDTGVDRSRILRIDDAAGPEALPELSQVSLPEVSPTDLLLLLFTSGTTGSPKAVRCTQGRLAAIGQRASEIYGFGSEEVCYCPMPLFHGNAVMALWAPALQVGASVALAGRFSASRFIDDVRRYRATRFTYVGKALAYVLATPERPDDAETPLRVGFGTEASARDRSEFESRFGCTLVEGYGSSEGGLAITRTPETPPDAVGMPGEGVAVLDPETGIERARAVIDPSGRIENPDEAIGELASRSGVQAFEGYYKNPEADAARVNHGWYWTGDLGYRDRAGFIYFAGRNDDWLRVDSENFAAAPVERILGRHPKVVAAAVYAVPDAQSADQVMAAVELQPGADQTDFCAGLWTFLAGQADLGTKWAPRFVRIVDALPLTATGKITKATLRRERWACTDPVLWRPERSSESYRFMTTDDADSLASDFARHGRGALLG